MTILSLLGDQGDGVLIISEVELRLEKLKIQDIVTMEKLKKLDPFNVRSTTLRSLEASSLQYLLLRNLITIYSS